MPSLSLQKRNFLRERSAGFYTTGPYFAAKIAMDLVPLRLLPPILYTLIAYYQMDLHPGAVHVLTFLVALVLVNAMSSAGGCPVS